MKSLGFAVSLGILEWLGLTKIFKTLKIWAEAMNDSSAKSAALEEDLSSTPSIHVHPHNF